MEKEELEKLADKLSKLINNKEDLSKLIALLNVRVSFAEENSSVKSDTLSKLISLLNVKVSFPENTQSTASSTHPVDNIPLSVFSNHKLTILESAALYLHSKGRRLVEISFALRRSEQSVWRVIHVAKSKTKRRITYDETGPTIPVPVFADGKRSALFALVSHCKTSLGMRNKEIAKILKRDERTISSVMSKGKGGASK